MRWILPAAFDNLLQKEMNLKRISKTEIKGDEEGGKMWRLIRLEQVTVFHHLPVQSKLENVFEQRKPFSKDQINGSPSFLLLLPLGRLW